MKPKKDKHKTIIETLLNTAALALTAAGVNFILAHDYYGFLLVIFGASLEFFKYWGRKYCYW